MSYDQVTIGSSAYDVYASVSDAATYLDATITEAGTAWRAADADTGARALVSATRWLDAASWAGTKTDSDQSLAWPRTSVIDVATDEIPTSLKYACIELAAMLVVDADLRTSLLTPAVNRMRAGSVHIDFFRPRDVQMLTFFPVNVMSFVGQWLGGGAVAGAIVNDVCETSNLESSYGFQHGI